MAEGHRGAPHRGGAEKDAEQKAANARSELDLRQRGASQAEDRRGEGRRDQRPTARVATCRHRWQKPGEHPRCGAWLVVRAHPAGGARGSPARRRRCGRDRAAARQRARLRRDPGSRRQVHSRSAAFSRASFRSWRRGACARRPRSPSRCWRPAAWRCRGRPTSKECAGGADEITATAERTARDQSAAAEAHRRGEQTRAEAETLDRATAEARRGATTPSPACEIESGSPASSSSRRRSASASKRLRASPSQRRTLRSLLGEDARDDIPPRSIGCVRSRSRPGTPPNPGELKRLEEEIDADDKLLRLRAVTDRRERALASIGLPDLGAAEAERERLRRGDRRDRSRPERSRGLCAGAARARVGHRSPAARSAQAQDRAARGPISRA